MRAAVLHELNSALRIHTDVEVPAPLAGQVLVRLAYSGVCHSQLMEVRGKRGPDPYLPHLLGHEGSGVVIQIGSGVTKVRAGDRVVLGWIKGVGADVSGPKYHSGPLTLNAGAVTTFNEYAVVSENRCVVFPDDIPMDIAVLFGCAVPTGAGIVINEINPPKGSTIAVFGLGGIGLSALMATRLYECSKVFAVDISESKLALAREFGATETINAARIDAVEAIRSATRGAGVDFSVEASGSTSVIEQAFASVRRGGGLCVFASHPPHGEVIRIDPHDLISGKQIRGTWGGACKPDADIPRLMDLYRRKALPLEKLLTKRYSLDQINEALSDLERQRVARPLIEIDASLGKDL